VNRLFNSRRDKAAQRPVARQTDGPGPGPVPAQGERNTPPRTVAGSTWVMACIAVLILIVLIIFVAQNTESVRVTLFGFHGRFPLAVALLAAVAAGCVLTLGLGTTRILQLRRIVRRRRRADLAAAKVAEAQVAADEAQTVEPVLETQVPVEVVPVEEAEGTSRVE
jgi:lipopolysaccharide assembly protein A